MALKIGSTSVSKMYKGSIEVTKGYLGSNLIYSSAPPTGSTPLTNSNFSTARDLWFTNQAQAEATYGLIGNWNTTAVTNMNSAFKGNTGVITNTFNENVGGWDVSNVTNMENMFRDQTLFNQDISYWNVGKVSKFVYMFYSSPAFNQDVSNWDVTGAWNIFNMFTNSNSFNQSLGGWDMKTMQTASTFIFSTAFSVSSYDSTLIGWEANLQSTFPNGVGYSFSPSIGFGNTKYTGGGSAATARASLVSNFNWTITDGGIA